MNAEMMNAEMDAITSAVVAAIRQVLHDTGREPATVEQQMLLVADIGLDSLDLAQTVVLLERSLGVDPFRAPSTVRPAVRTVADLVGIYHRSAPSQASQGQP